MKKLSFKEALSLFQDKDLPLLWKGLHGLEKESLRVDAHGDLALTPHPKGLGSKLTNPYITTDFSESQLELITPPFPKPEAALKFLVKLHYQVVKNLENKEMIWPFSMPCRLPNEASLPIAQYGPSKAGQEKEIYRKALALRYGKYMQMISGVHYNFSFSTDLWDFLARKLKLKVTKKFINNAYMDTARNFMRYRWILIYLFAASPFKDSTYRCGLMTKNLSKVLSMKFGAISLRSSRCGYNNPAKIKVSLNSFEEYIQDIRTAVEKRHPPYTKLGLEKNGERIQLNDHLLQSASEYYASIRVKPLSVKHGILKGLEQGGAGYLELRIFDLNPFIPFGVDLEQMDFTHLFLIYCLLKESPEVREKELSEFNDLQQDVALKGRNLSPALKKQALTVLNEMEDLAKALGQGKLLKKMQKEIVDPRQRPWKKILKAQSPNEDFTQLGLRITKKHHRDFLNKKV